MGRCLTWCVIPGRACQRKHGFAYGTNRLESWLYGSGAFSRRRVAGFGATIPPHREDTCPQEV